ncbi:organic solute transporter Ostalpha-domain-containing protein [Paraphoma chrysanthemicola]|uniref:Organic solute transporter Ostalpha-domain-containing protein n=1 Tax=Paraphoma chrysanthemicola TaxID=798071 RepID=A0A8K0W316_9PLEO|nr:organic solute transporter Ostalpha-domain-containing protein [Paraphoma chrysanthemicola]
MHAIVLSTRGLFSGKDDDSNSTSQHICPVKDTTGPTIVPFVGTLTYHQFSVILAGACALLSALVVCVLIATHAMNYSNPVQQRQIIRVMLLIPWVALFSFLIVWQEGAGDYLVESLDFGCAIALSSFLLLMCDFVLSHRGGFDDLFGQGAWSRGAFAGSSPQWLKRLWYGVLQFIPTSIIIWIATIISLAVGTYCKQSNNIHFAHIWITALKLIVTTVAILSALKFYGKNKTKLQQHRILLKLFTFKSIIGLNVLQTFVISILSGHNVLKPSKYLTYHDVDTGLASLILACEMPIFSILMLFAFPSTPYRSSGPAAGPLSAIVDAFNISDLLSAFIRGPMRLVREQQRQILRQDSMRVDAGADPMLNTYEGDDHNGGPKDPRISSAV